MMYGVCFGAGALMMLVAILLVGICRSKGDERQEEPDNAENGTRGKREFETVCAVMHLIRCGKVKASTPNWQVYSEVKKWKEAGNDTHQG